MKYCKPCTIQSVQRLDIVLSFSSFAVLNSLQQPGQEAIWTMCH